MTTPKNGGPAFPIQNAQYTEAYGGAPGMGLRDWFAGNVAANQMQLTGHNVNEHQAAVTARWAYMVADALIAVREG